MLKAIIFDLDGTLIDSSKDIGLALKKTLKEVGLEDKYPERVEDYIGGGIKALLEKVLGNDFKEEYVNIFRKHYTENPVVYTKPYDNVPEVLKELKDMNFKLAVVSNKLEDLSKEILKRLGLIQFFDFVAGGDTFSEKKPSPIPILKTLEILGEESEKTLVVGDTEADLISGKEAGTKTALARWGYVKINSVKPDYELQTPEDILKVVKSFPQL